MLEETTKLLGPWPILQFMFGVSVLAFGVFMIIRGLGTKGEPHVQIEDKRLEWEAYERLRNIEENTQKVADNQRQMLENVRSATEQIRQLTEQLKALVSVIWNKNAGL